mmetsp:Transcript_31532/g.96484  ORF Transcript_31532/g.96484 Transcript_31532/m.96484 type:complete len:84 (-) Transcript_31532:3252-3503(-)
MKECVRRSAPQLRCPTSTRTAYGQLAAQPLENPVGHLVERIAFIKDEVNLFVVAKPLYVRCRCTGEQNDQSIEMPLPQFERDL